MVRSTSLSNLQLGRKGFGWQLILLYKIEFISSAMVYCVSTEVRLDALIVEQKKARPQQMLAGVRYV